MRTCEFSTLIGFLLPTGKKEKFQPAKEGFDKAPPNLCPFRVADYCITEQKNHLFT
jgi:hypothetical protein